MSTLDALIKGHKRLSLFKKFSEQAQETKTRINLAPQEIWEAADDEALAALEWEINGLNGVQVTPLFREEAS